MLSYLFLFVSGLFFLLAEKKDNFVRFHALQSILFTAAWIVIYLAWSTVWLVLGLFSAMLGFGGPLSAIGTLVDLLFRGFFVLWIFLMVNAYRGKQWKLPIIGDLAEKQLKKE
jgi:uncharacterized membrane protein